MRRKGWRVRTSGAPASAAPRARVLARAILMACALVLGISSLTHGQKSDQFLVIVPSSTPVTSLPRATVAALFLKQTRRWDNGTDVLPIDQGERSHVRAHFSREVLRRPAGAVKAYWNQRVFLGRDTPPREVATDAQVVEFVATHPGAIGYVSPSARLTGVRVVTVFPGRDR